MCSANISLNRNNFQNSEISTDSSAEVVLPMTQRLLELIPDHIRVMYPELKELSEVTMVFKVTKGGKTAKALTIHEVLLNIFSHLKVSDILNIRLVSKEWLEVSCDNSLWKKLYTEQFYFQPTHSSSFFDMYCQRVLAGNNIRNLMLAEEKVGRLARGDRCKEWSAQMQEFIHPTEEVKEATFSSDSSKVITRFCGKQNDITRIWDMATGSCQVFENRADLQEKCYIIAGNGKTECRILQTGEVVLTDITDESSQSSRKIQGMVGVEAIFSPDSSKLILWSKDALYVWDIAKGLLTDVCRLSDPRTKIQDIKFSHDQKTLFFITFNTAQAAQQAECATVEMRNVPGGSKAAIYETPSPSSSSSQEVRNIFCIYKWSLDRAPTLHYHFHSLRGQTFTNFIEWDWQAGKSWESCSKIKINQISNNSENFHFILFSSLPVTDINQGTAVFVNINRGIRYLCQHDNSTFRFFAQDNDNVIFNYNPENVTLEKVCIQDNLSGRLSHLVERGTKWLDVSSDGRYVAFGNMSKILIADVVARQFHTLYASQQRLFVDVKFSPDGCHLLASVKNKSHKKHGAFVFNFVDPAHKNGSTASVKAEEVGMEDEKAELRKDVPFEPSAKRQRIER